MAKGFSAKAVSAQDLQKEMWRGIQMENDIPPQYKREWARDDLLFGIPAFFPRFIGVYFCMHMYKHKYRTSIKMIPAAQRDASYRQMLSQIIQKTCKKDI